MRFAVTVAKAVLAHLYIAWIHPFADGNGRTARLVEFQILAQSGLIPLPAANLLRDHYNKTRDRYYAELRARIGVRRPDQPLHRVRSTGLRRWAARADRLHPAPTMGRGLGELRPLGVSRSRHPIDSAQEAPRARHGARRQRAPPAAPTGEPTGGRGVRSERIPYLEPRRERPPRHGAAEAGEPGILPGQPGTDPRLPAAVD